MTTNVTIAMSVRNAETTLGAALASLEAQTYSDWELVIVDDRSEDSSALIAEGAAANDPRIRVIRRYRPLGIGARLNEILSVARGPLLARMDADDIAYPERLERQVAYLKTHPEVDVVGCSMLVFATGGEAIGKRRAPVHHSEICGRPQASIPLFHPTWLGRLNWFRQWRYLPEALRCEDWDLLYRAHRTSVFANLSEPLVGYREELVLRNILTGRRHLARRAARDLWHRREPVAATATLVRHAAKGVADTIAVTTGLDHRLLRHRAGPMSPAELAEWRSLWSSVSAAARSPRYKDPSSSTSRSSA